MKLTKGFRVLDLQKKKVHLKDKSFLSKASGIWDARLHIGDTAIVAINRAGRSEASECFLALIPLAAQPSFGSGL